MFDFLLDRKRRGVIGLFEKIKMHVLNRVVDLCIIWGQTDIETFAKEYNLPKSKLLFHPFHITLEKYQFDIFDGGYIFAGGNGGRDYKTLIEALKQIELPVFIATTLPNISSLATSYKHITVRGITPDEFREKMAGCTIFVECHDIDFFRTAGHQTILNAMWMGKPVVLADRKSAKGYITDGTDGLVVDAGDIEALRSKIIALLNDISLARKIGENAQKKARRPEYRTLNNQQSIYNIAIRRHCKRLNLSAEDRLIEMY